MNPACDELQKRQDETETLLERLREAVNAHIHEVQGSTIALRKRSTGRDSFSPGTGETTKEQSPSLSPRSSSPQSAASSSHPPRVFVPSSVNLSFPTIESASGSLSGETSLPRTGSVSDVTLRYRPSMTKTTPTMFRRPTYNAWPGPRDFPSPNIYDLTLKMNADIGIESFWENIIEIFVTNFYASRVSLSIPYDLTDISNTPWGLKATYNGSINRQKTRIRLEQRQTQEAPTPIGGNESDSTYDDSSDSDVSTLRFGPRDEKKGRKGRRKSAMASIEEQLDRMLDVGHRGKVHSNLKPLDYEEEPLIDNMGVKRVLDRGSIVTLSREYLDLEQMSCREEGIVQSCRTQVEEEAGNTNPERGKRDSARSDVLAAWERQYSELSGQMPKYRESEKPLTSPWSQSPAPSPAILKEREESPFFQSVESAFSPNDDSDSASGNSVYAIGMENHRSIIHIPLVHPQTSKSITSEGDSNGSGGHPRIVPIAIVSFLSAVTPYPPHLVTSLSVFAPLIATSLSQAIRHSNVVHLLANSPIVSPRYARPRSERFRPTDRRRKRPTAEDSPGTYSSTTNSETSTPSWDLQGHLFSPAVAEAETPSPFRSTLSTEVDYFSMRGHLRPSVNAPSSEDRPPSSSSSHDNAPIEWDKSSSDKQLPPIKVRRRPRKVRMVHSYGATSQIPGSVRSSPRRVKSPRRSDPVDSSDPYRMHTPSSRLLKVVVDSIPVHVFTASPGTGTITWANARTLAYRGVTAEEYVTNPHASLHPEDSSEFLRRWDRMIKHEADGISQIVRIKRFDGQYRWFAARVVPLRDSRGSVVHWFGTAMDIHDAREAEINSARQEEIKASELKYRSLAEASPQIVFAATPALGISYANSQWMSYSGVTYEETAKLGFLSFVHPNDRERCVLPIHGDDLQFSVEIRLQAADRSYRWHLVKCIRIEEHEDGRENVWLGTCTDIHGHKMLEQQLKESHEAAKAAEAEHKKRAEDALETRREQEFFIDMVSHELRNPLSAIVQSSDVVLNSLRGMIARKNISAAISHELSEDIETIKSIGLCTMHMRRLIDDTINVSKLENGMLQITPVDCQPMTIVKQIQQIFDAELQSKKIEMSIIQDKTYENLGIKWVRADPRRISQILINLLSNAIKFLDGRPERKITLTFSMSTTPPKPDATPLHSSDLEPDPELQDLYLSFSINDTGPGLKRAEMAALFQRFSQATPRIHVRYGGSGLGLFISKRLVELQGGRIYVDSIEGKGSTFSFFIKVERSSRSNVVTAPKVSSPVPVQTEELLIDNGNQIHVLVVEDNLINQCLLKKQLIGSGYRVSVANHGQEAMDMILFSQASPKDMVHIVLMDVEMPILDGLQATQKLRELEAKGELRNHIPVIAVSANARDEQKKRMFDAGADSYLTKPFQLAELVAKLREQTDLVMKGIKAGFRCPKAEKRDTHKAEIRSKSIHLERK